MRNTIAIVGGGFCGTVLAANLLRRPPADATDIILIERGPAVGRGVAYAAREFPYLLNVPAARLSADSEDDLQFLHFAQRRMPDAGGEDFLPRALYGDYLQDLLARAERAAPAHVRLLRIAGEVRRVVPRGGDGGGTYVAEFSDRPPIAAERVILALGNPPPAPLPWATAIRDHPAYRHDPWDLPKTLSAEHSVLIVGNGLTMADAASALTQHAARAPMLHTISRHGVVPLPQTEFRPSAVRGNGEALLARADSLRKVLAMIRELTREVELRGGDWREVVTFVRHLAPTLWQRLPDAEKRRFVRHLQVHWGAHRHRLPPQLAERLAALRRSGRLRVNAGRIDKVIPVGRQLQVSWRARGGKRRHAHGGHAGQCNGSGLRARTFHGSVACIAAQCRIGVRGSAQPRSAHGAIRGLRGRAGPRARAPLLSRTHAARRVLGGDRRCGATQACGAARGAPRDATRGAPHGATRGAPHGAPRGEPRYTSFVRQVSKRSNSARVLYMETPVRSSPPRSANPSTSTGRAA